MPGRREVAVALGAWLLLCGQAAAQAPGNLFRSLSLSTRQEPIKILADSLELDHQASTITYRGGVTVTQGDVSLESDRLVITYDPESMGEADPALAARDQAPGRIKQVVAEGRVRIRQGDRLAEGGVAVFDQAAQTVVLRHGAVLHEGPNQVAGERVVVYLREERSVVESGSNSRVTAVLYPEADEDEEPSTDGDLVAEQGETQ